MPSYTTCYHPFLPMLDITCSPHKYYKTSDLLFWCIMAVASRRIAAQPMLLQRLSRSVTDLLWKHLRTTPYTLAMVQSLALLCTWPFPTSSSSTDPRSIFVGCMLQAGTQIGLHRAKFAQDFARVPTRLSTSELAEWVRTWEACNVVARR